MALIASTEFLAGAPIPRLLSYSKVLCTKTYKPSTRTLNASILERLSFQFRRVRKELAMPLRFQLHDPCPKCGKTLVHAVIEAHPTDRNIAIHNLQCGDCGPVKTSVISLKPGKASPQEAA
jgi:hypothetical protein